MGSKNAVSFSRSRWKERPGKVALRMDGVKNLFRELGPIFEKSTWWE